MRTIWILMLAVCGSMMMLATADDIPSFDDFAKMHKKKYLGSSRSKAQVNFQASVKKIQALNSQAAANNFDTRFNVNEFSDLSIEDFRKQRMGLQVPASSRAFQATTRSTTTRTTTTRTTRTTTTRSTTTRTTRSTTTRTTRTTTTRSTTTRTTRTTTTRSTTTRTTTTTTTRTTTTTTTTTSRTPAGSFDWSAQPNVMTPIKDQGWCGSCWAFAAIALIETYYARKGNPLTRLSDQQLVDCETISYGCEGGWPEYALDYVKDKGSMLESAYGYTGLDGTCAYNSASVITRIGSYVGSRSETDWFNKLATVGPILVCLDADSFQHYTSGILMRASCERDTVNHAVVIVGYGTENSIPYWKIRNSWGTSWGEQGYVRIERDKNACAVRNEDAYYITS